METFEDLVCQIEHAFPHLAGAGEPVLCVLGFATASLVAYVVTRKKTWLASIAIAALYVLPLAV